jgi:hypothetical protein
VQGGTTWRRSTHTFHGGVVHDEYGAALYLPSDEMGDPPPSQARDLSHYSFDRSGSRLEIESVVEGDLRPLPAEGEGDSSEGVTDDELISFDAEEGSLPVIRRAEDVAGIEGPAVLALPVVADGAGPVHACPQPADGRVEPCDSDGLAIRGVAATSPLDGSQVVWTGPFLVHVDADGRLSSLVVLEGGGYAEGDSES